MARQIDSEDIKPNQPADIMLADGSLAVGGTSIEAISKETLHAEHMAALAFMEEEITVMVQETSDQNAENPVVVGNNGMFKQFFRGQPTTAKRKFVDSLIVKSGRVNTIEVQNGAGERTYAIRQPSAHKYPFMMISDKNPKGGEWLTRRLAESI